MGEGAAVAVVEPDAAGEAEKRAPSGRLELTNTYPSVESLVGKVLAALRDRDAEALDALRVTEREYREIIWPELPQANDPRHTLTVDFHWMLLDANSDRGIREAIDRHGGVDFEFVDLVPTRGIKQHETFEILSRCALEVRRRDDGREAEIRVFGSIVRRGDRHKILGYPN